MYTTDLYTKHLHTVVKLQSYETVSSGYRDIVSELTQFVYHITIYVYQFEYVIYLEYLSENKYMMNIGECCCLCCNEVSNIVDGAK